MFAFVLNRARAAYKTNTRTHARTLDWQRLRCRADVSSYTCRGKWGTAEFQPSCFCTASRWRTQNSPPDACVRACVRAKVLDAVLIPFRQIVCFKTAHFKKKKWCNCISVCILLKKQVYLSDHTRLVREQSLLLVTWMCVFALRGFKAIFTPRSSCKVTWKTLERPSFTSSASIGWALSSAVEVRPGAKRTSLAAPQPWRQKWLFFWGWGRCDQNQSEDSGEKENQRHRGRGPAAGGRDNDINGPGFLLWFF